MILRSPPGMKGLCPCRPGALTRRCERPGASIILSPKGIFTVADRGEGKALKRTTGSLKSPASPLPNPNGIPPASPGLSRQRDYPGKRDPLSFQPQRGCGPNGRRANRHNPVGLGGARSAPDGSVTPNIEHRTKPLAPSLPFAKWRRGTGRGGAHKNAQRLQSPISPVIPAFIFGQILLSTFIPSPTP